MIVGVLIGLAAWLGLSLLFMVLFAVLCLAKGIEDDDPDTQAAVAEAEPRWELPAPAPARIRDEDPFADEECEDDPDEDDGTTLLLPVDDAGRRCRVCGCSDDDCRGCIERTGRPCYWVDEDLCSACSTGIAPSTAHAQRGGVTMDQTRYAKADQRLLDVLDDIRTERRSQNQKWGVQNHDPLYWLGILTEEVGELSQAMIEQAIIEAEEDEWFGRMRAEAIHVAAVAAAFVEWVDRRRGRGCEGSRVTK